MKKSKLIFLPLLLLGILSSCSNGEGNGSINIVIWEDESNVEMVKVLTDEYITHYKKTYPDAKVPNIIFENQTEKSAIEKMATVSATGNGPDIAAVTHDTIVSGVADKLIAPALFDQALMYRMSEDAINAVTVDETIYGYPITAESVTVLYDKTKINASDLVSFEAFKATGKKLAWMMTDDDGGYYTWSFYTDSVLFGAKGNDKNSINIGTPQSVSNVVEFYNKFTDSVNSNSPEMGVSLVVNGTDNVVGLVSSPFILSSMKNALGDKLGIAKLPTINGVEMRPFSGYKSYVVSRYSKNGVIAQDIANYITSYDAQAWRLHSAGYLPACPLDATEDISEMVDSSPEALVFAESLSLSMVMPSISQMANFWRPMNNAASYFWNNKGTLTSNDVKIKLDEVTQTLKG